MTYPSGKKILIIDDEPDLCLLLKDYFLRRNYEVVISHALNEGKKLINSIRPDVIFLDNNLPDGPGWSIAGFIAASFPSIYLVLVSAFDRTAPEMPEGARFHTIEKPITISDLDRQFAQF